MPRSKARYWSLVIAGSNSAMILRAGAASSHNRSIAVITESLVGEIGVLGLGDVEIGDVRPALGARHDGCTTGMMCAVSPMSVEPVRWPPRSNEPGPNRLAVRQLDQMLERGVEF